MHIQKYDEALFEKPKTLKSKKERRHERQIDEIIDIVIPIIKERGFNNFTFNEIIQECTVSRATFFNLVQTKEVLYTYISLRGLDIWYEHSLRVLQYESCTRVHAMGQLVAYYVFTKTNPILHRAIFMHNYIPSDINDNLDLSARYDEKLGQITGILDVIMQAASDNKEIKLEGVMAPKLYAQSLWHCVIGFTTNELHNGTDFNLERLISYYRTYMRAISDLLEWQPLSTEFDFNKEMIKILKTIYPKESLDFLTPDFATKLKEVI